MKGLIDSTLREGEQMPGTSFSLADKKRIVAHLARIGIEEIEIGIATPYNHELKKLLRHCRNNHPETRIALWSPCKREHIHLATELKTDVLSLSIPASEILIQKKLECDHNWVLTAVKQSINYAQERGVNFISLGIEDATRATPEFLQKLILTAAKAGVARVRLADTVGIASPLVIASLIQAVRLYFQGDIGVHMHNDFGMATANSLTAIEAGADYADVTALGIGERAGNARLEEVAGFLALRNGRTYQTTALKPLTELMASLTGKQLDSTRPVVGERIFYCESGLHLHGLKKDTATYEPFAPEKVGMERKLFYGKKIGKREIKDCLEPIGIRLECNQLEKLVSEVRLFASRMNRPMLYDEFKSFITAATHHFPASFTQNSPSASP